MDLTLVKALLDARRETRQVVGIRDTWRLDTEREAYETMFAVSKMLEWQQAGWKIAATNAQMQSQLRTTSPVFGPTFQENFRQAPAEIAHDRLLSPIIECEFFFFMRRSLPARTVPYTFDDVLEAIGRVHVGIEIAECRFAEEKLPTKEFIIADGFASGWYVVGKEIEAWRQAFETGVDVTLYKNNRVKGSGTSSDVMGHPVLPIVWLANKLNAMGRQISEGQIVSSGTCNILARARKGDVFKAVYDGLSVIDLQIT